MTSSLGDLLKEYTLPVVRQKDERKALLQELVDRTGYPLGRILARTAKMQTPKDLRFILSAMKATKGENDRHRFNIVMFTPPSLPL